MHFPHIITSDSDSGSANAQAGLDDAKNAVRVDPGPGLHPDRITEPAIWTYERADGRHLVVPFTAPEVPDGQIQIDTVFGERLPCPPEVLVLPGVGEPLLAGSASLSLAWKR
ncbi:hypothetical protein ACGFIK_14000 [Micromonospora sp. NPDC048871]|uniref:hypothetical protein n=1 Tax=unclassified Micromonospora TaxID=2617518 RepID=UPI00371F2C9B